MKKNVTLILVVLLMTASMSAQTNEEMPASVSETMYLMPKRGMEEKFEAAIKAHNLKYHPDGPYKAGLRKVEYGEKAGWYLWVFGPSTYASLDSRPTKENGHADDWSKTVDPLVETYGETQLWQLNDELSFGIDLLRKSNYYEVWMVDLKRGEYYRFKALAEKLKKAHEALATTSFIVYDNSIHTKNGADVGIIWSFNSYAEWGNDPGVKSFYEKIYGSGSWQHLLDEWMDITVDYTSEIRSFVK